MYDKNYYLAHREEILARAKKWREDHPEQYRKALKRCVKRNGLKYKIQQKLYRCANWLKITDKHRVKKMLVGYSPIILGIKQKNVTRT